MFELLTIKSKTNNSQLDIGFLCEALLFYKTVNLFVQKDELIQLFNKCSIRGIEKLIDEEKLNLHIQEEFLGPMIFPNGQNTKYKINTFGSQETDKETTLYKAFHEITRNSSKSIRLTDLFVQKTESFRYDSNLLDGIYKDLYNKNYIRTILSIYLNNLLPELQISPFEIEFELIESGSFQVFENTHTIESNLDIEKISKLYSATYNQELKELYSGFLLTLAESKGDLDISTKFNSEIATKTLHSEFISCNLNQILFKQEQQNNIIQFNNKIIKDYKSIGEAVNSDSLKFSIFLQILDNSDKFRNWLHNIVVSDDNDSINLIEEYYKELSKETVIDKLPSKVLRFSFLETLGTLLDGVGLGGIGTAISTFDALVLDKLVKGWKPNQFIYDTLIPKLPTKK